MRCNIQAVLAISALAAMSPARGAQLFPIAELQARVEAFAGRPATVDPRLLLPDCARPEFSWVPTGRSVMVWCPSPDWRVYVPVATASPSTAPWQNMVTALPQTPSGPPTPPLIRRGDRVVVEAGGAGFVVAVEAVAEGDARDGRVLLRSAAGGRRMTGIVAADGRVSINGLSGMVNGR